jgi:DNA polymerase-1
MLQSLITNYKPHSVVLCWDGGTPDFRKALVPSYKANRGKDRDELEYLDFMCQLQELWRILSQFGILQIKRKGIEADDLLYHASRLLDGDAIIVTADEDLLQAVTDQVSVFKPGKKEQLITPDTMEIPVEDFVEYKTLQGDSSDNIPGVNGVGPKTAQKISCEGGILHSGWRLR